MQNAINTSTAIHRHHLPQANNTLLVCDGGMETTMIFHEGIDLPAFASFTLLSSAQGISKLKEYYGRYADIAKRHSAGFIIETPTWRANSDWGTKLGYSSAELEAINRQSIQLLVELREQWKSAINPIVIGGVIGPRGDGYSVATRMTIEEAASYHGEQMRIFADTPRRSGHRLYPQLCRRSCGYYARCKNPPDAGGAIFYPGDRWSFAFRTTSARCDNQSRCRQRQLPRLLSDQLRAPQPLRTYFWRRRGMAGAYSWLACQRLTQKPCGVGRVHQSRCRQPGGTGAELSITP